MNSGLWLRVGREGKLNNVNSVNFSAVPGNRYRLNTSFIKLKLLVYILFSDPPSELLFHSNVARADMVFREVKRST